MLYEVITELNARMPEEGGFYLWIKKAFGDLHGYTAAWAYWLSNIVWLPTVLPLAEQRVREPRRITSYNVCYTKLLRFQ